jgi:hypothetical protein
LSSSHRIQEEEKQGHSALQPGHLFLSYLSSHHGIIFLHFTSFKIQKKEEKNS